ncbi:cation:proton antiporter regulatory subunit [Actinoplanes auranticolor]|uniref:Potassium transporter TrkA n=1 Tax=Actinoplanes auranticolor TaxID=47988 RepID=A0A919SGS5_9ACTN|nr:cation:proton antiporter regulatory subunit [Actinoplanes auranticolor]GIM72435.1 potassium transporter TrkA [Actinoplanes auranticolor]
MTIERIPLPGVGVCHAITTRAHQRLGVIAHTTGQRDIVLYDPNDPDRAACTLPLEPDEARWIADLLNTTVTVDHLADPEQHLTGITAARIRLPAGSHYDGRSLAATSPGTGASIIAVIRGQQVITAPHPDFVLHHDDTLVAIGDHHGITALTDMLTNTAPDTPANH